MATKKNASPKTKTGKQRGERGKTKEEYMQGNKNAEKWTPAVVTKKLERMIEILCEDEATGEQADNPVRANTIKLYKEVCLMVGITGQIFSEWKEKFIRKTRKNADGNMENNPNYNDSVSELIQKISDICECRLQYSGMRMDEFILKNHYGFVDQIDHTTKGEQLPGGNNTIVQAPVVQIIEQL